jgi:acetyl-CoA C-acetyltransferase
MVRARDAGIVVAGGMESMTNAPFLLPKARSGYRFGHVQALDSIVHDGLWCTFDSCVMGASTDHYTAGTAHSRALQDEFAAASHERAARATKDGVMGEEIVAVEVPQRRGEALRVVEDEGIRPDSSAESLAGLSAAFTPDGTVTAGNASQISDGGSALVLASADVAREQGLEPLAEILGYGQVAGPDTSLLSQPSRAIQAALQQAGLGVADVDLFEINEAFAAVALASMSDLGISSDVVNVNGGAIALGHPIGMSGNRLVLTLVSELRRRGGGIGAAGLCGGGGQGDAIIVRVG